MEGTARRPTISYSMPSETESFLSSHICFPLAILCQTFLDAEPSNLLNQWQRQGLFQRKLDRPFGGLEFRKLLLKSASRRWRRIKTDVLRVGGVNHQYSFVRKSRQPVFQAFTSSRGTSADTHPHLAQF